MLLSRLCISTLVRCPNRLGLQNARCLLSHITSPTLSQPVIHEKSNQPAAAALTKPSDENNEWLWAYLRERKSFSELNEDQRRRVIEIGSFTSLFLTVCIFISLLQKFKHSEKVVTVFQTRFPKVDGRNWSTCRPSMNAKVSTGQWRSDLTRLVRLHFRSM